MKKILILGGTQFIGRNLVERLLDVEDYTITLFNRQKTQVDLFPNLNKIKGDRATADVNQIANENWDYVIDISCYYPDSLSNILQCLNHNLIRYILISTCSVYDDDNYKDPLKDEQSEILLCDHNQKTDLTTSTYGNRKAECERVLQASGFDYLILRPSLVYGRYDHTDRFYYWLYQLKYYNPLLLPDHGSRELSLTYVHDLVEVIKRSIESTSSSAVYNVITIPQTTIKQIVAYASDILDKNSTIINAPVDFLKEHEISQWTDMPLWLDGDYFTHSGEKLIQDFQFEPTDFSLSIKQSIDYYSGLGWPKPISGISEQRKTSLIQQVKATGADLIQ